LIEQSDQVSITVTTDRSVKGLRLLTDEESKLVSGGFIEFASHLAKPEFEEKFWPLDYAFSGPSLSSEANQRGFS
jgi:hypothetical protein